jgi:hypothetical protein
VDIRVPNKPPREKLDKGPHPWERVEYVRPEPDELEDISLERALEGYTALRRDIAWFRDEVREALTTGNAMRLRELLELFVWGQDLRRVYRGGVHTPPEPEPVQTATSPPVLKPAPKMGRGGYRPRRPKPPAHHGDDWEV